MVVFLIYQICIILFILVMVFSITIREFSQAYVADLFGDCTAKNLGLLTLNPLKHLKHLNFLGTICMIFFGVGWKSPLPVNYKNFSNPKIKMAIIAAAGPLSHLFLVLLGVFYKKIYEVFLFNFFDGLFIELVSYVIKSLIFLNVSFFIFNLLPIPPLDGFKIVSAFFPNKMYNFISKYNFEMLGSFMLTYLFFNGGLKKVILKGGGFILKVFNIYF